MYTMGEPADDLPMITTSERRAFKRCVTRWWWEYREGLRGTEINSKLWFGIGIHEALASLYMKGIARNRDFIDVWRAFCDEDEISTMIRTQNEDGEAAWVEARALGEAMLNGYIDHYGWDVDWDVIYTEEPFQILVPDPANKDNDVAIFASTFDGVIRDKRDGRIKLIEHKTAASISTQHLLLDEQGGSYFAVADHVLHDKGVLKKNEHITEIIYNFLRKGLPDDRPKDAQGYATNNPTKQHYIDAIEGSGYSVPAKVTLDQLVEMAADNCVAVLGERSKVQPASLFVREPCVRTTAERKTQIDRIANEVKAMNMYRDGQLELIKTGTRDCHWDCAFFNMCQLHEQTTDWQEFRDAVFIVRNPYDRYKLAKSAAEVV